MDKNFFAFNDMRQTRVNLAGLRTYRKSSYCRIRFAFSEEHIFSIEYLTEKERDAEFEKLEQWLGTSKFV